MSVVKELRERLKLKYAGDCKCGHCALVPDELVARAADLIELLEVEIAAIGIYDAFPYDGAAGTTKPAWMPFGNSFKQAEARSLARRNIGAYGPSPEVKT